MEKSKFRLLLVGYCCEREQVINSLVVYHSLSKAIAAGKDYIEDIPQLKGFVVLEVVGFKPGILEISEKVYSYVR